MKVYVVQVWYNSGTMPERSTFGKKIELVGKGKISIISGGTVITIEEEAAPGKAVDVGKEKKKNPDFPEGSLESLRPMLRGVFNIDISENADSYWLEIDSKATMAPEKAANKLKRAGKGHVEVARALVLSDRAIRENLQWGRLDKEQLSAQIAEVAEVMRPLFQTRRSKHK